MNNELIIRLWNLVYDVNFPHYVIRIKLENSASRSFYLSTNFCDSPWIFSAYTLWIDRKETAEAIAKSVEKDKRWTGKVIFCEVVRITSKQFFDELNQFINEQRSRDTITFYEETE